MKKSVLGWILILATAFGTTLSRAEATLQGTVVIDRENGPPAAEVSVSAEGVVAGSAHPTASSTLGKFRLTFPAGRPGQEVKLTVILQGRYRDWAVVNDVLLDKIVLPEPRGARAVEIIVSRAAQREQYAGAAKPGGLPAGGCSHACGLESVVFPRTTAYPALGNTPGSTTYSEQPLRCGRGPVPGCREGC